MAAPAIANASGTYLPPIGDMAGITSHGQSSVTYLASIGDMAGTYMLFIVDVANLARPGQSLR